MDTATVRREHRERTAVEEVDRAADRVVRADLPDREAQEAQAGGSKMHRFELRPRVSRRLQRLLRIRWRLRIPTLAAPMRRTRRSW